MFLQYIRRTFKKLDKHEHCKHVTVQSSATKNGLDHLGSHSLWDPVNPTSQGFQKGPGEIKQGKMIKFNTSIAPTDMLI